MARSRIGSGEHYVGVTLTAPARALSVAEAGPVEHRSAMFRRGGAICLLFVALICAAHVIHPTGVPGQVTYLLVTVGAAVAAVSGAQRQAIARRFSWTWIAVGVMLSALADLVYYLLGWIGRTVGDVSIADAPWLASYIAIAIGLSSLIVGGRGVRTSRRRRLDRHRIVHGSGRDRCDAVRRGTRHRQRFVAIPCSTRSVWTAYPILDAALLAVVAQAIISRRLRNRNGMLPELRRRRCG